MLFTVLHFPEERVHGQAAIKMPTARFEPVVSRGTPGFESWRLNQLAKGPSWKVCFAREVDRRWTLSSGQICWWACEASLKALPVAFFAFAAVRNASYALVNFFSILALSQLVEASAYKPRSTSRDHGFEFSGRPFYCRLTVDSFFREAQNCEEQCS